MPPAVTYYKPTSRIVHGVAFRTIDLSTADGSALRGVVASQDRYSMDMDIRARALLSLRRVATAVCNKRTKVQLILEIDIQIAVVPPHLKPNPSSILHLKKSINIPSSYPFVGYFHSAQ